MTATALPLSPPIDTRALAERLRGIAGVAEVRVFPSDVWVICADNDVARDEDIIGVLLDVLPLEVEFHLTSIDRAGMVPAGQRVL